MFFKELAVKEVPQGCRLQALNCWAVPWILMGPRVRVLYPPPHVTEHSDHAVQGSLTPSNTLHLSWVTQFYNPNRDFKAVWPLLPRHGSMLQVSIPTLGPSQGWPPNAGGGFVPERYLLRTPTSHVRLQELHCVQLLHPQSTETQKTFTGRYV